MLLPRLNYNWYLCDNGPAMQRRVTIACASLLNNRMAGQRAALRGFSIVPFLCFMLLGCASTPPAPAVLPTWELANGERVTPVSLGHARVSYDRPLPSGLTQKLSDEFTLVSVNRAADWEELQRAYFLNATKTTPDFSNGMVVGILANVGEFSVPEWPIRINSVRTRSRLGWVDATFAPGMYYPVQTAGYLQLAYVPGVRTICMVRINQATFVIRPASEVY